MVAATLLYEPYLSQHHSDTFPLISYNISWFGCFAPTTCVLLLLLNQTHATASQAGAFDQLKPAPLA